MSCNPLNIRLDETYANDTWDGFSWAVSDVDADDTSFAGVLTQAVFTIKDSSGTVLLTLDSDNAGEITLTTTAANAWDITIEPRTLSITAGTHQWALRLYDDSLTPEHRKVTLAGILPILPDPQS